MQPHDVDWLEDHDSATVTSVVELDELLDRLHRDSEHPILVCVSGPSGHMTIGVAHTLSILTFVYADGDPPYPTSNNGTNDLTEHDFTICGHHSAFAGKNMISNETARDGMRLFVEYGALSLAIRWGEA